MAADRERRMVMAGRARDRGRPDAAWRIAQDLARLLEAA